jgi:hypothetical protein
MTAPNVTPLATSEVASFTLERFAWDAPDRLEVSGWFSGLDAAPSGEPTLIAYCGDEAHRLEAVSDSSSGPPKDGLRWRAIFAWQEVPVPFDAAVLELGADTRFELPGPSEPQVPVAERVAPEAAPADDAYGSEQFVAALLAKELSEARAEIASLRSRLAEREYTRAQLKDAHRPVVEARAEAERLLGHLAAVESALKGAEY